MRIVGLALALALAGAGLGACGASSSGAFGRAGFQHAEYAYAVDYREGAKSKFLPAEWRLDNWTRSHGEMTQRLTPTYMGTFEVDENDDGEISGRERREEPLYDLRFVHARHDGVIWLKALPLSKQQSERDMDLFVADVARELRGNRFSITVKPEEGAEISGKSMEAVITECHRGRLAGHDAASGIIDVGETRASASARLQVTVIRFEYLAPIRRIHGPQPWPTVRRNGQELARRAALLTVGYANSATRFGDGQGDYVELLRQIRIGDVRGGFEPTPTPAPSVSASAVASTF